VSQQKINSSSKNHVHFPSNTESELVIKNPVDKLSACYDVIK
jgi:hypothetical protein